MYFIWSHLIFLRSESTYLILVTNWKLPGETSRTVHCCYFCMMTSRSCHILIRCQLIIVWCLWEVEVFSWIPYIHVFISIDDIFGFRYMSIPMICLCIWFCKIHFIEHRPCFNVCSLGGGSWKIMWPFLCVHLCLVWKLCSK
jgi:hypothetical protein